MTENTARRALERVEAAIAMDHAAIAAAGVRNEMVDIVDVPSSDAVRMGQIFGGYATDSGAVVNDRTAMRVSAVYAAVRLIAGSVATTPCLVYRRKKSGERDRASDHPFWYLLNEEACDLFTAATFWEYVTAQMLLRDVSAAYIVRPNQYSTAVDGLLPIRRDDITPVRLGRRLVYRISEQQENGSTKYFTADPADVLHFPGFGFDGCRSMSIVQWAARQAIGIALQADAHAASMFGSGATVQYAVTMPDNKTMTQEQQDLFREAWVAKYSTGRGVSQIPLVLTEGLDVKELSMTAADAQLVESRQFNVVDIARAIGVPPHMIGATEKTSSWGTGVEQQSIGYVKYGLMPHLNRFVQELNRKLFPRSSRFFFEFNVDAQMEGDSKAQAEYFSKALGGPGSQGWMVPNEVRALKNLPKVKGGDKLIVAGAAPANDPNKPKDPADPNNPDEPSDPKPEGEDDE